MPLPQQPESLPPRAIELDLPSTAPPRPRAAATSRPSRGQQHRRSRPGPSVRQEPTTDIKQQLRLPALLLVVALLLTVADISIAGSMGGTLALGPASIVTVTGGPARRASGRGRGRGQREGRGGKHERQAQSARHAAL